MPPPPPVGVPKAHSPVRVQPGSVFKAKVCTTGGVTYNRTPTGWLKLVAEFVKTMFELWNPGAIASACVVIVTATFAPAASVPLEGLAESQPAFVFTLQFTALAPELLRVSTFVAGVKGPPLLPEMFQPLRSLIWRSSGTV